MCFKRLEYIDRLVGLSSCKVDNGGDNGRYDDPEQLKPVEEGKIEKGWSTRAIEGGPHEYNEGDDE